MKKKKKIRDFILLLRYRDTCLFYIDEEITKCSSRIVVMKILAIRFSLKDRLSILILFESIFIIWMNLLDILE